MMEYNREGWGCPGCGVIYWAKPLMEKDVRCEYEWVRVTVKYSDEGVLMKEMWHFDQTWSKENEAE